MNTYSVAYNQLTGQYEIHADRCSHLSKSFIDHLGEGEAVSAVAAAVDFEDVNDGIENVEIKSCATRKI